MGIAVGRFRAALRLTAESGQILCSSLTGKCLVGVNEFYIFVVIGSIYMATGIFGKDSEIHGLDI